MSEKPGIAANYNRAFCYLENIGVPMLRAKKWLNLILLGGYLEKGPIVEMSNGWTSRPIVLHHWAWHPIGWIRAQISRLTYKKVAREFITADMGPIPDNYKPTK